MNSLPRPPSQGEGGATSNFELGDELPNAGGPGRRVFAAKRRGALGFERDVAAHVLVSDGEQEEAAFVERVRKAVALSHAGLLRLLGLGRTSIDGAERTYVIAERSDAPSLADLIARSAAARAPIPAGVALSIGAAAAEVLDHAHRRGVSHGSIEPRRILVGREGSVRIADFCLDRAGEPAGDVAALAACLAACGLSPEAFGGAFDTKAGPPDAGDVSDQLSALAFRASPGAAGRSIAAWVSSLSAPVQTALEPETARVWLRLFGPQASLDRSLEAVARSGAEVVDRSAGVARFPDDDVEAALRLARIVASSEVAAAVTIGPRSSAWRDLFGDAFDGIPPQSVWLSAEAADLARVAFVLSSIGSSGRVFAAAGERGIAGAGRFVGRLDELGWLARSLGEATDRGPLRVSVVGPAGIGKTRLLLELARRAKKGGAQAHVVRFSQSATGPLACVLAIAREVGADTGAENPSASAGQLSRLLESLARDAPCVLCLDDAHLADRESLELLEAAFAATTPGTRLLIVESIRGEHSAGTSSLALGELSDDDVALLVASRLGARLVPPELFEPIVERTGGHPLFLEEALQTLVAGALVDVHDGVARLREAAEIRLPASFEALARARVKELDAASRRVLAAAAVAGPGAPPERVAALAGLPPESEEEIVWQLVRGGFARRDDGGGLHLSAVYADAVLATIGHDDEIELHRAAAQALAQSSTFDDLAARASHLERSGDLAEAARAHLAAAQAAKAQGASAAAAGHLARALAGLEAAVDIEHAVEQLAELGPTHAIGSDVEDALAHALEVIDGSPSSAIRASVRLTLARLLGRAPESAWVLLDSAASIDGHDPAELARARVAVARAAGYPARGIEAARLLVGAVDADPASLRDAAQLAVWAGETELARGALARADAVSPAPRRLLGEALYLEGKAEEAELELARALRELRKGDDREEHARAALSYASILLGDAGRRFSALSEASRAARAAGNREIVEMAAMHLDAFSASDDAESLERLDRRTSAARARGWTLGSLVGATLSAEAGGASRELARDLAREATDLGHAVLAARLAAVALDKRSDAQ